MFLTPKKVVGTEERRSPTKFQGLREMESLRGRVWRKEEKSQDIITELGGNKHLITHYNTWQICYTLSMEFRGQEFRLNDWLYQSGFFELQLTDIQSKNKNNNKLINQFFKILRRECYWLKCV